MAVTHAAVADTTVCESLLASTPVALGDQLVRCMGIVRVTFALHLKAASYNLKRLARHLAPPKLGY